MVHADPTRLVQVFLNLLLNAAQALPDGQADLHEVKVSSFVDARGVVVEVHDSGPGVPADLRERIFAPFFTTKAVGVGTGLGLSLSHATVHAPGGGGTLELDPTVACGSCFRVVLPPSAEVVRFSPSPPSRRPDEGKVLLIDDDEPLGTSLARVLRLGDRLEVTPRAAEALDRIQRGARYDLILCDVMMPELGGGDFVARLEIVAPELVPRVVLMTGGAVTEAQRRFVEQTRLEVLHPLPRCAGRPAHRASDASGNESFKACRAPCRTGPGSTALTAGLGAARPPPGTRVRRRRRGR